MADTVSDLALAIEALAPGARYGGSTTANTREAYEALDWTDERPKPTWAEVEAAEIPQPRRSVPKSTVIARLIAAGKIGAAKQALESSPAAWARWTASDKPAVYADDPDAIALLKAIGADPDTVLAP